MLDRFGYPVFVKPVSSLSGVSFADNAEELAEAVKIAFTHDDKVLIEERILGVQIKCAVIGNETPEASVLAEFPLETKGQGLDRKTSECIIPVSYTHLGFRWRFCGSGWGRPPNTFSSFWPPFVSSPLTLTTAPNPSIQS